MTNDALIKEARAECAQKYLCSYWFSFSETGSGCIDEILSQIARAGKAYHSTEYWTEAEDGDPSHADLIQDAAIRAANIIDRLADALTAANAREAALRKELQAYKDEELRSESGEWLCDRCRQWQAMNAPNLGIECDMCEACADEVDALGGDA